jgi:hypothetical protein
MNSKGGSNAEDTIQRDTFHTILLEKWNENRYDELDMQLYKKKK